MVMETPSPQCVGREFVRQYYTLLHEAPLHLHRFYSHNSCFVHGGVEKPGEEQPPVTGQSDIHKKICTLDFRDCHAKIRQVDSQATVGNAVVVQVTGELSNNGQPMRRFMQTFVLVPQLPKKYYVHNDIFRYQDEVFHDNDTDTENLDDVGIDSETETQESITTNEAVLTQSTGYYEPAPQTISNGNVHAEEVIKPTQPITIPEPEIEREKTPEPEQTPEEEPEPVKEPVYEAKEQEKQPEEETEVEPQGPPKPVTWAAIARDKNQNNNVAPAPVPAPAKAPAVPQQKPSDVKTEQGQAPQPQRTARPNRERAAPRERDGSRPGMETDETRRSRYPDSHQVFVGNLPHNTSDNDLKTFFSRYGKVIELRINKKAGQTSVPNFGFVVFEDEKAVQEVLCHRGNLQLPDGHRLNVEEKKQRGEGGRPGSGTRLGRGGMGPGRGMHSGPSRGGGRGGMGPMMNRSDNRGRGGGFGGPRR